VITPFICWVLAPLALLALSLGCGLLLERIARVALPGTLLPAAGFAVVLVAAHVQRFRCGADNARAGTWSRPSLLCFF
jgi:hypothetical protein